MKRKVWLILLLVIGGGSLLYGSLFHTAMVEEEGEREISVPVPVLPGLGDVPPAPAGDVATEPQQQKPGSDDVDPFRTPSADGTPAGNSDNPFENPATLPGIKFEKRTEKIVETREEPEWVIVRDATVGGVMRLANGQLKRTYSGKTPALCPT
jgi:hypothetical protein